MGPVHLGEGGTHIFAKFFPNHESMPKSPPALKTLLSSTGGGGGCPNIAQILSELDTLAFGGGGVAVHPQSHTPVMRSWIYIGHIALMILAYLFLFDIRLYNVCSTDGQILRQVCVVGCNGEAEVKDAPSKVFIL